MDWSIPMNRQTYGFHHITAISGHPQITMDFYHGFLGLRLIKQTVNFDDPNTYHFYFGDYNASPGSVLTFFPWAFSKPGVIGDSQVSEIGLLIPKGAYDFWKHRLTAFNTTVTEEIRFNEKLIKFKDPFGLPLYLKESDQALTKSYVFDDINESSSIIGVGGVVLSLEDYTKTKDLLVNTFFYHQTNEDDIFVRLSSTDYNYTIDLRKKPSVKAKMGVGTVHHIALSVDSLEEEQAFQSQLKRLGYTPTEVKDRNYFKSIYFRDHNQILFELATKNPGFTIDEPLETLGETLKLPKQYEPYRHQIEAVLLPFNKRVIRKSK